MKAPSLGRKPKTAPAAETKPAAAPKKTAKKLVLLNLKPRISEKAYGLSENGNVYTFDIETGVNKFDVARAVESQFDVTSTKVRIVALPSKSVRRYRERGRKSFSGQKSGVRKAYVTLKEGDKLPIFAAMEESQIPVKETR